MKCIFPILLFTLFCFSCDGIITQKKSSDEFLKEELKTINWNEVDSYPLFLNCNEGATKIKQQSCFETTLHNHLISSIQKQELVSSILIEDTILIHFNITRDSEFLITEIVGDSLTYDTFPNLQNLLFESIKHLPNVSPALKRGVPVSTEFVLPLVIKTQ